MNRRATVTVLLILSVGAVVMVAAASCAVQPAPVNAGDPYSLEAIAQAAIRGTNQAILERSQGMTADAAEYARTVEAAASATRGAVDATARAQVEEAIRITRTAEARESEARATATAAAVLAEAGRATATASILATQAALDLREREAEITRGIVLSWAWGIVLVLGAGSLLAVLVYFVWRRANVRHIQRGPMGEAGILVIGDRIVVPELAQGPVVQVAGLLPAPLANDHPQAHATRESRAKVDAVRAVAGGVGRGAVGPGLAGELFGGSVRDADAKYPIVEIIEPDDPAIRPLVEEVKGKLLDSGE